MPDHTSPARAGEPGGLLDALTNKYAWLDTAYGQFLHYVPGIDCDNWDEWWDPGSVPGYQANELTAACGRTINADLPGIFTRMHADRCRRCCDRLGIPHGEGAPLNDKSLEDLRRSLGWVPTRYCASEDGRGCMTVHREDEPCIGPVLSASEADR